MLERLTADLHVHTCLSPCGGLDMTPGNIAKEARIKKIDIVAITDHNSAENVRAVARAAAHDDKPLWIVPGIEITSSEEVHVIGLFDSPESAEQMQQTVFEHLMPGENDEEVFGLQVIASAQDEVEGFNPRLLIGATRLGVERIVEEIHRLDGLAIAAHIDRPSYSILSQLGFIAPALEVDALEISRRTTFAEARLKYQAYASRTMIASSDAHDLAVLGLNPTVFMLDRSELEKKRVISELRHAFRGSGGRRIIEEA